MKPNQVQNTLQNVLNWSRLGLIQRLIDQTDRHKMTYTLH